MLSAIVIGASLLHPVGGRGIEGVAAPVDRHLCQSVDQPFGRVAPQRAAVAAVVDHHRGQEPAAVERDDLVAGLGLRTFGDKMAAHIGPGPAPVGGVGEAIRPQLVQGDLHPPAVDLRIQVRPADDAHQGQGLHELGLAGVAEVVLHEGRPGFEEYVEVHFIVGQRIGGPGQDVDRERGPLLEVKRVGRQREVAFTLIGGDRELRYLLADIADRIAAFPVGTLFVAHDHSLESQTSSGPVAGKDGRGVHSTSPVRSMLCVK